MIVLAGGCFDPLHFGHLVHLQEAKKLGEVLYVAVTRDAYVNKGPLRPVFPEHERLAMVQALSIVHGAFLTDSAQQALERIHPDIYVKGSEYVGLLPEEAWCMANGIAVAYTVGKTYSSTKLLRHYDRLQQGR
jgi:cytidyltransferase-like protein